MKILLNNRMLYEAIGSLNNVGFVPTMGGIHKGHISLINKSKKNCKFFFKVLHARFKGGGTNRLVV